MNALRYVKALVLLLLVLSATPLQAQVAQQPSVQDTVARIIGRMKRN